MKVYTILKNLVQSIKSSLAEAKDYTDARGDYIVEYGSKGIWKYRKWASGIYEAWASSNDSMAMTTTLTAYNYWGGKSFDISALGFIQIDSIQATGNASGGYSATKVDWWNLNTIAISDRSGTSYTINVRHFFEIKGFWKTFEQVGGGNS